jgi:siroheme synthase (precorrin-2 oxidase/ferrochelatase)
VEEESEQESPIFDEQCDETPKKTQRGRPKGATSYSVGDITELLDAIEEILPQNDEQWVLVADYYNTKYADRHEKQNRKAGALRRKYHELLFGVKSGGGEETKEQKRARQIEQIINEKAGVLVSEEATTTQSIESVSPRKGSRMKVEKEILDFLNKSEQLQAERFEKKIKIEEPKANMFAQLLTKL